MRKKPAKMTSDQLIDQIAGDLTAVKPARLGTSATILWILSILAMTSALVAMTGHLRSDVTVGPMPARIVFGVLGALMTIVAAGTGFVRLLVPARKVPGPAFFVLAVGLLQMAWSVIAAGWATGGWDVHGFQGLDVGGFRCTVTQSVYALVLALPLMISAKRFAPTKLIPLGLLIGVMAVAAGFGGLLVHCPSDDVVHLAVYHLLPAILLSVGACGFVASRLRW